MQRINTTLDVTPTQYTHSTVSTRGKARLSRAFWSGFLAVAAIQGIGVQNSWSAPAASKTPSLKKTASTTTLKQPAKPKPALTTVKAGDAPRSQISTRAGSVSSNTTLVEWNQPAPAETIAKTPVEDKPAPASTGTRVAVVNTDKPAAVTPEGPGVLAVPVKPEKGEQPEPAAPPQPTDTTPANPPVTVTPGPGIPPTPMEDTGLTPNDAEGREVVTVRVVGNRVVGEDAVLLAIAATKPGAAFSVRQADLDKRRVFELGFFARVDYQVAPNLQNPNKIDVTFVVTENRVVTKYRFEGNSELKAEDLEKVIVSKTGAVLSSANVDEDVKKIQDAYRQKGFAAIVTDVHQEADGTVVYVVQEGKISKIELDGLKKTKPSLVRSMILTRPGDPFNEEKIQKDLNRIYDMGYFEDVSYKVSDDRDAPGSLIVTVMLKEKRTGQITFGVGFDSRSKISGFAGISESNFQGSGKNVGIQFEIGSQRSFNFSYGDRFVGSKNASYNISVFNQTTFREPRSVERLLGVNTGDDKTFSYEERREGVRFNFTQPLDFERTRNILYGYRLEKVNLFLRDNDNNSKPVDLPASSDGRTSAFSLGFLRDKRDLKLDPSKGGRELLTVEEGLKGLGGTSNFTKLDLDLRHYIPLIGAQKRGELPKLVLAGRMVAGQTFGNLPAFEQYFIGGSDTVRGYDADEQFGDNQIYGNMELRFRFQRKVQFVAFVDAGSAYGGSFASSDSFNALFGYGVGARLQTPIGPVRLDIARGDRGIKTHFGIGSTF